MNQEKVLGRAEFPNESIEVLQAKLPEIMAVLFKEKVGIMTDEIYESLTTHAEKTHIFTDEDQCIQFLIRAFDTQGRYKDQYKLMAFILHFMLLDAAGFSIQVQNKHIIFVNNGHKRIFLHEVSHLVETVISELVSTSLADASQAKELVRSIKAEKEKYTAFKMRHMISSTGILMSTLGYVILLAAEMGQYADISTISLHSLYASLIVFSATYFKGLHSYRQLGEEKRARQAERLTNIFPSSEEV